MFFTKFLASLILVSFAKATINFYRSGWLDRVVQYRKNEFIKDVQNLPPINFRASITNAPPGYVDSPDWDFDSVTRLLTLIRESETTRGVYRVLRRALKPSRRIMSRQKSFNYFPRDKHLPVQDIYYDMSSVENIKESWEDDADGKKEPISDDSIVYVSNAVEAKLPSAEISVGMLKEILWNRAKAARVMPTTQRTTIPWKPKNKTTAASSSTSGGSDAAATTAADGGGDANSTAADGDDSKTTNASGTADGGGGESTGATGTGGADEGATTAAADGETAAADGEAAAVTEAPAAE